mgnify:CR=1 FL=1
MGVLSFALVFTLLRDLVGFFYLLPKSFILIGTLLATFIGSWMASRGPRIKKISLSVMPGQEKLRGLKIAQISDLHVGPTIKAKYVKQVVEKTNSLSADLIALTGDIADGKVDLYQEEALPLKDLSSSLGVFYVPGNHEYYWDIHGWLKVMENLNMHILINQNKLVQFQGEKLSVSGIPDLQSTHVKADLKASLAGSEESKFKILLSHRPGIADQASQLGFHLQLSGHTHGGQFFPWTLVVKMVHKYAQGLHQLNQMWIYVNPGTGSWGPLLRLGTIPEITLIELK